jgi:hypothetical protein
MPSRSLFLSLCLLTGLQFAMAPVLHAEETRTDYAVDIVVFEDVEGKYINSEQWPSPPPVTNEQAMAADTASAPETATTIAPTTGSTPTPAATPPTTAAATNTGSNVVASPTGPADAAQNPDIHDIDPGKYDLLNAAVKKLIASPRYHILVRKSWIQPGLDSKDAVNIDMNSANDPESAGAVGSLTGTVKIVLERYLHLYTDLVYHRPDTTAIVPAGDSATPVATPVPVQDFVIKEHRRMRSNELHYIDHPLVGILIKIVPVKTKVETSP